VVCRLSSFKYTSAPWRTLKRSERAQGVSRTPPRRRGRARRISSRSITSFADRSAARSWFVGLVDAQTPGRLAPRVLGQAPLEIAHERSVRTGFRGLPVREQ